MIYIPPLKLDYIFQNVLAGSQYVFLGIFFLALSIMAGTFNMDGRTYLLMIGLAGIMLYSFFNIGLYLAIVVVGGAIAVYSFMRLVKG